MFGVCGVYAYRNWTSEETEEIPSDSKPEEEPATYFSACPQIYVDESSCPYPLAETVKSGGCKSSRGPRRRCARTATRCWESRKALSSRFRGSPRYMLRSCTSPGTRSNLLLLSFRLANLRLPEISLHRNEQRCLGLKDSGCGLDVSLARNESVSLMQGEKWEAPRLFIARERS